MFEGIEKNNANWNLNANKVSCNCAAIQSTSSYLSCGSLTRVVFSFMWITRPVTLARVYWKFLKSYTLNNQNNFEHNLTSISSTKVEYVSLYVFVHLSNSIWQLGNKKKSSTSFTLFYCFVSCCCCFFCSHVISIDLKLKIN